MFWQRTQKWIFHLSHIDYLRLILWGMLVALTIANIPLMAWQGISFLFPSLHPSNYLAMMVVIPVAALLTLRTKVQRKYGNIAEEIYAGILCYIEAVCLAVLLAMVTITMVYCTIAASAFIPYQDTVLAHIDVALGLNWLEYLKWVDNRPLVRDFIFFYAYYSMIPQLYFCLTALFISRQPLNLYRFLLILLFNLLSAIVLVTLCPSEGVLPQLGVNYKDYPHTSLHAGLQHLDHLRKLRAGSMPALFPDGVRGLVTFPSVHVATGVAYIWGFWQIPWLRWPFLILNLLLIAATPVIGVHYFIDCFAGAGIAGLGIYVSGILLRKRKISAQPQSSVT